MVPAGCPKQPAVQRLIESLRFAIPDSGADCSTTGGNRSDTGVIPGETSLQGLRMKSVLSLIGIVFIIAWLVLWLAVKVAFGAIHLLVVIGVILIVLAFV